MDTVYVKAKEYDRRMDRNLSRYKPFRDAEARTKIPKVYLALGGVFVIFILIFFNVAAPLITNLIGWVYPANESFKAIEAAGQHRKQQWLTYWTVFGFVQTLEYFTDTLLYWLPFYFLFKTIFVLWLILPQFKGATLLYLRVFRPNLTFLRNKVHHSVDAGASSPK